MCYTIVYICTIARRIHGDERKAASPVYSCQLSSCLGVKPQAPGEPCAAEGLFVERNLQRRSSWTLEVALDHSITSMRTTPLLRLARKAELGNDVPSEASNSKPYTTPPGFKPPTMSEQWRYAAQKHPASRYGTAGALLVGLVAYAFAKREEQKHGSQEEGQGELRRRPGS